MVGDIFLDVEDLKLLWEGFGAIKRLKKVKNLQTVLVNYNRDQLRENISKICLDYCWE